MNEMSEQMMSDEYIKLMRLLAENRRLQTELTTAISERNEYKVWADQRHSAALYAEEQNEQYHEACDRAERAEATLAAIRAWADNHASDEFVYYAQAAQDVSALLDAAPKDTP